MKANNKLVLTGILILIFIILSKFISINEEGGNYVIEDSLLGVIIFHNLFVLIFYVLMAIAFILFGLKKIRIK